jgi:hypothetical protein
LNSSGTSLVYSTYLGGSNNEQGNGITVDSSGNAYVTGYTDSFIYPTTAGAYQTTLGGGIDVFVIKMNTTGTGLVYSTYLGGSGTEQGSSIAVDSSGNAYVTGYTQSSNYPTTLGAYQTTYGGGTYDGFVTELNTTGTGLVYSTYLSGSGDDIGYGIVVDSSGNAYVTGYTTSSNFPTTAGAYQTTLGGGQDAFVTKMNTTGTGLVYSTYLGGSTGGEQGRGIAVDSSGNAYVTGYTNSANFPTTAGAFQTTNIGGQDVFVTKLNTTGTALVYSTYLGGSNNEQGLGIAVDSSNYMYVAGYTTSSNFPTTVGAYLTVGSVINEPFVTKLRGGAALAVSTSAPASSPQATDVATTFTQPLQALVTDGAGTAVSGATVVLNAPASGASGVFSGGSGVISNGGLTYTDVSNASGQFATPPTFTANSSVGVYNVLAQVSAPTANASDYNVDNFKLQNLAANAVSGQSYSYYLPFVANSAAGFSSQVTVQNLGNASASISNQYFDKAGATVGAAYSANIAAKSSWVAANPLALGSTGTGVITSNQPLSVIVSQTTPFGSSAYTAPAEASASLIAPLAINQAAGFNTRLTIANVGAIASSATITFYDSVGNIIPDATKILQLAAHSSQSLDQTAAASGLAQGFYGWARVEGSAGGQLVGQVLEQRSDIGFVALANTQVYIQPANTISNTTLYAPAIFNKAFGSFVTGANIINPNTNPVQVSITYYDATGKAYVANPFTLAAHGVDSIYQGASFAQGLPNGGLPPGFYGSASVMTTGGSVVLVVNEAGGTTKAGTAQSGTYAARGASSNSTNATIGLPIVANNGQGGYTSGLTILNTTDRATSGSLSYYNPDGILVAGTSQSFTIAAHASLPVYQGAVGLPNGLPNGFYGQAVVTGASTHSLIVTTNVQSDSLFFTYTE